MTFDGFLQQQESRIRQRVISTAPIPVSIQPALRAQHIPCSSRSRRVTHEGMSQIEMDRVYRRRWIEKRRQERATVQARRRRAA